MDEKTEAKILNYMEKQGYEKKDYYLHMENILSILGDMEEDELDSVDEPEDEEDELDSVDEPEDEEDEPETPKIKKISVVK